MHISAAKATQDQVDEIVLDHLPRQGEWSEADYLWLTDHSNRLLEFTDGFLETLPMPTDSHQTILSFLYDRLRELTRREGGKVLFAPLRLKIRERKFREPDLIFVHQAQDPRRQNRYWLGADLVLEVVSPDQPERDLVDKRADYAEAGVPEYWIVNPLDQTITVLKLTGPEYSEHGRFERGQSATSSGLEFSVEVAAVFDAQ